MPKSWRSRAVWFAISAVITQVIIWVWGLWWLIGGLVVLSIVGSLLAKIGIPHARKLDGLLGAVWTLFSTAVLGALVPAALPAVREIQGGNVKSGMIQLGILVLVVVVVFYHFGRLPQSWSALDRSTRRLTASGGRRRRSFRRR